MCWHKWTKWETYENQYRRIIRDNAYDCVDIRQKRTCKKCGKAQDEFVR